MMAASVGQRVRLVEPVGRYPFCIAEAGMTGTVTHADDRLICVTLDTYISSLAEWDNALCFERDADESCYREFFSACEVL